MREDNLCLVILAGGLGTRFGGDKQITPLPGINKTIMELSIADAVDAGIRHVVMVISPHIRVSVERDILPQLPDGLTLDLAIQDVNAVPAAFAHIAVKRVKPWGTGHALLCAKRFVKDKAIVITADDYYGRRAFHQLVTHFSHSHRWASVGYPVKNTLSDSGAVNRGICHIDSNNALLQVEEVLNIIRKDGEITGTDSQGSEVKLSGDELASMTFWGVDTQLFEVLEHNFSTFLQMVDNPETDEFFLPDQIQFCIDANTAEVKVYRASDPWIGMTYKDELNCVAQAIQLQRAG